MAYHYRKRTKGGYIKMAGKKPYTKKRYSKPKKFATRVKRVIMKTSETKRKDFGYDKGELFHNVAYAVPMNNTTGRGPSIGTDQQSRIGDQIYTSGYMMRILFGQKADRPNVTFRLAFVEVPRGYAFSYGRYFHNISGNVLLDPFNKDFVKVIKQFFIKPNQAALAASGGREYTFTRRFWVPYKHKMVFGPEDGATGMMMPAKDLYWVFAAYDAYGTVTSDNIAYLQCAQSLYFKDP